MTQQWKLVPVEPTPEMWAAVNKLDDQMAAGAYDGKGASIEQVWACLVDAAPAKPDAPLASMARAIFGDQIGGQMDAMAGTPTPPASAQDDAKDERQADACPRCDGSGEITVMSDSSPDAHDVVVCCDHCQGSGAAVDAAKYLAAALSGEKYRHIQVWAEYRNFHRSLCARFGYGHDEIHFRRDLVSLEEAIAAKVAAPAAGDAQPQALPPKMPKHETDGGEYPSNDFVSPLYSVVESIEKRLREKNAGQQGDAA
ncbi:MAG: hypothetical protein ACN6PJ_30895 [Achromobacter sp.]|uniref:hypothetical protein n=1 Tax=Achromobacter sp. TaxID=134375 RepID=UPI003D03F3D5